MSDSPVTHSPFLESWESPFDDAAGRLDDEVVRIRRHLHAHPEPSGEEVETTNFVQRRLNAAGIASRRCVSDEGREVGLIADVTVGEPRSETPLVALRCDMDALRMPDQKQVEYRSQNDGVTHACGHDAHTAIVLGSACAAAQLNGAAPRRPGDAAGLRLRWLFQPAEETSGGARWLVDQGAMEGVDYVLGLHVDPERRVGEVGVRYGVLTANCDEVTITLSGHGGHSARPHHTLDPVAAAAQLIQALYSQLPRSIDSRDASVFSVGRITGGYAPNVIPETVELQGSLRSTANSARTTLKLRIREICDGVAQASGVRIALDFAEPLNAVENDREVAAALETASRRVLGNRGVQLIDRPSLGGEDFSVYLDYAPGALLRLGCAVPETRAPFLHSPLFDLDERCLSIGMRILFRAAVLLSRVREPDESFGEGI
ncbi:MAG: M20 family metallopeptidase [Planctomycetaceae bacterium]